MIAEQLLQFTVRTHVSCVRTADSMSPVEPHVGHGVDGMVMSRPSERNIPTMKRTERIRDEGPSQPIAACDRGLEDPGDPPLVIAGGLTL
jgi:hypothetical protein